MIFGFIIEEVEEWVKHHAPRWLVNFLCDREFDTSMTIVNSTPYDLVCGNKIQEHNIKDFYDCFPDYIPVGCSVICPIKEIIRAGIKGDSFRNFDLIYLFHDDVGVERKSQIQFRDHAGKPEKSWFKVFMYYNTLQCRQSDSFNIVKSKITNEYSDNLLVFAGNGMNNYQIYSESPYFSIMPIEKNNLYMVKGNSKDKENSNNVHLWKDKYDNGLYIRYGRWYFTDGYIKLKYDLDNPELQDLVLEISRGNPDEGTRLTLGVKTGGLHQQWSFGSLGVDGGTIVSKLNNYVIDVADSNFEDFAKIVMWPANGGSNQLWTTHRIYVAMDQW